MFVTIIWSLIFLLLGVKVIHLIDGTDLLRVGGLVLGGETIVTGLRSSLRDREHGRMIERNRDRERE
jgi:hypothetical protein